MRSNKMVLGLLVAAGLVAAYWFLLLAPKREEVASLESQVTQKRGEVATAEATLATYRQARDAYQETYARVTSLGKAVPADDDVRSLVVQLDSVAKATKVNFRSISVAGASGPSTAPAGTTAVGPTPPPGAVSTGADGFATMPFALSFSGTYADLSELFTELERFVTVTEGRIDVKGRLVRIDSIVLSPKQGTLPDDLDANVSASTFLVSPAQPVAGAPTGQAPAATPPTTTASSDGGGTPPTTTAAATGAIE